MKRIFNKVYKFIRDFILDDVDEKSDRIPKYHKGFLSKKDPGNRLNERFKKQKKHNRWE